MQDAASYLPLLKKQRRQGQRHGDPGDQRGQQKCRRQAQGFGQTGHAGKDADIGETRQVEQAVGIRRVQQQQQVDDFRVIILP